MNRPAEGYEDENVAVDVAVAVDENVDVVDVT